MKSLLQDKIKKFYKKTGIKIPMKTCCTILGITYEFIRHEDRFGGSNGDKYRKLIKELNLLDFLPKQNADQKMQ